MERHPNSARFHDLLREAGELHDLKQGDYGRGEDPFANVRASEEWGIPGWQGAMIRLNDKVRRLQSLATKGSLNNEAAVDSFMDIAVYALIARVLFEEASPETCAPVKCPSSDCMCSKPAILIPAPFTGTPIVDDDASEWENFDPVEAAPGCALLERARLTGRHEGAMSVAVRQEIEDAADAACNGGGYTPCNQPDECGQKCIRPFGHA